MKTTTYDIDSKFFKLLRWFNGKSEYFYRKTDWNTCSLWRHSLWTLGVIAPFKIAVVSFIIMFVLTMLSAAGGGFWGYEDPFTEPWYMWIAFIATTCVVASICIVLMILFGVANCYYREKREARKEAEVNQEQPKPTALGLMLQSWKDKTCNKIEIR